MSLRHELTQKTSCGNKRTLVKTNVFVQNRQLPKKPKKYIKHLKDDMMILKSLINLRHDKGIILSGTTMTQ